MTWCSFPGGTRQGKFQINSLIALFLLVQEGLWLTARITWTSDLPLKWLPCKEDLKPNEI